MLTVLERLGDRMLGLLVPRVTASAACSFWRWCEACPGWPARKHWCTRFTSCAVQCDYCSPGYC